MQTVITQIVRAIGATATIVDGVTDDQWTNPTPCPDWDATTLTNHFVGGMRLFAGAIQRGEPAVNLDGEWLGDDPKAAYHRAARDDIAAWHTPGALDRTFELSFGTVPGPMAAVIHLTEIVVHGIDLAVATGQEAVVDEPLAQELLATMKGMGTIDSFRVPDVFGPEVPASDDEPPHRRLMAYLGRGISVGVRLTVVVREELSPED